MPFNWAPLSEREKGREGGREREREREREGEGGRDCMLNLSQYLHVNICIMITSSPPSIICTSIYMIYMILGGQAEQGTDSA